MKGNIPVKLTIVTAVFNAIAAGNRERLIRCIESVAVLKTPHEHLVYDGASTDGTVELLRELELNTPGLKVTSEKDTGIYNALNKGVRDAHGEWLYVLGCDDYIFMPVQFDFELEKIHPNEDVVVSPVWVQDGVSRNRYSGHCRNLLFGAPYCHQGVVMRVDKVRQLGGFDEQYPLCADYVLMLKYHMSGMHVGYRKNPYAVFSMGGASSKRGEGFGESFDAIREYINLSTREFNRFRRYIILPIRKSVSFLFHSDRIVRISACYMILRTIRFYMVVSFNRLKIWTLK